MSLLERLKLARMCWKMAGNLDHALSARARVLMAEVQPKPNSPEWKRHEVYAKLLKEFPTHSRKSIALTIEVIKCCG
jgi:hypothetical protein